MTKKSGNVVVETPARTITNFSSRDYNWSLPKSPVRAGSEDAFALPSRFGNTLVYPKLSTAKPQS